MMKRRVTSSHYLSVLVACGAAVVAVPRVSAHQFWLEKGEKGRFVVRFGEAGSNGEKPEYERSPGVLDKMQGVSVWTMYPGKSGIEPELYKAKPLEDGFVVEEVSEKLPLLAQTTFPVRKREGTASFTTAFARWQPKGVEAEPVTTLDLIPAAEGGKVTVFYKGKPARDVNVLVFSPASEPVEAKSGEDGSVSFKSEGKGDFVVWAYHSEPAEGVYLGTGYTALTYMVCLSWKQD